MKEQQPATKCDIYKKTLLVKYIYLLVYLAFPQITRIVFLL